MRKQYLANVALVLLSSLFTLRADPLVTVSAQGARVNSLRADGVELSGRQSVWVFDHTAGRFSYAAVPHEVSISQSDGHSVDFVVSVSLVTDVTALEVVLPRLAVGTVVGLSNSDSRYAGRGDVPVCQASWRGGEWFVVDANDLTFGGQLVQCIPREEWQIRLGSSNGGAMPVSLSSLRHLSAASTYTFRFRYVFSASGTTVYQANRPVVDGWLAANAQARTPADHRPVGVLMVCRSKPSLKNPGGWCDDANIDVTTAAGQVTLHNALMATINGSVANMLSLNGQGITLWDLEGLGNNPFIGDPRLLPLIAPVVDGFADEMFAAIRNAGLKAGVLVRDDHVQVPAEGHLFVPRRYLNEAERRSELHDKVAYAVARWDVKHVYVDSWAGTYDTLQYLSESFPGVSLYIERQYMTPFEYLYCVGFSMANLFRDQTPASVKTFVPNARTWLCAVNQPDDGSPKENAIMNGVKNGDILGVRAWWTGGSDWMIARKLQAQAAW